MRRPAAVRVLPLLAATAVLAACTSVGVGISVPLGGLGGVSVGVDSSGRVSGGVTVGAGGVSVGVGGTTQLPPPKPAGKVDSKPAQAAAAPASAASSGTSSGAAAAAVVAPASAASGAGR